MKPLNMNIVYFGSSRFSLTILENLCLANFTPKLIVSVPDKPKGRGLKAQPTAISLFAQKAKIPLITPSSLKTEEIKEKLSSLSADLFIIADYGKILPAFLLSIPKIASIGVHPSLLPLYRGPAPINWALLNGDKETGVTIFKVDAGLDTGDIILQKPVSIAWDDTVYSLNKKLACEGANLLVESLNIFRKEELKSVAQDEKRASFAPKFRKEDGKINWQDSAVNIHNKIRALSGWPSVYAFYKGKMIKIIEAEAILAAVENAPGTVETIKKDGICVSTGSGTLKIKRVKPEGKREMDACAFVSGYRIKPGDKLDL